MTANGARQTQEDFAGAEPRGAGTGTTRDTAGVAAPPPLIYALGLLGGFGLEALLPAIDLPRGVAWPVGLVVLGLGIALSAWFITTFRGARTPVDLRKPTSTVVTTGPFRLSRNPGYLALTLIYVGVAILTEAVWAFASLLPVWLFIRWGVIAREERYLEDRFGDQYVRYKRGTRRWL